MVSKKQWVWGEGHRGNQTHKNIYSSLLASYRISTFSRQMLEDAFHVNSSMSGEAEGRREKQSQKCLIESSDFLAVKAGTEKELLRAKTRVGQGMASVYTKGLSTRKQWKRRQGHGLLHSSAGPLQKNAEAFGASCSIEKEAPAFCVSYLHCPLC